MRARNLVHVVSAHAEGEVGDVIVGGVAPPPGDTLVAQRRWLAQDDTLRQFVLNEPRGGVFRHVNLLVPPKSPVADAAFLVMEPEDTPPMSGSNAICVATVLLETGILPMAEPMSDLTLETPAGLVQVRADCAGGKVQSVSLTNVPSFVDRLDASLEVEGYGTLTVDTAFGGDAYCLVDSAALGFALSADEARDLARLGARITDAANDQLGFAHPEGLWDHISFCQFAGPLHERDGVLTGTNAVVIKPGKIDRSPCGTGTSARMAVLHAKGLMAVGDRFLSKSLIGSEFRCRIAGQTHLGDRQAIVPEVSGRAWITGTHQHMLDPDDPFPSGYRVSDTWGA